MSSSDAIGFRWLRTGDDTFAAMLLAIDTAKASIEFESYIYTPGPIGERFRAALMRASRRGVRVRRLQAQTVHPPAQARCEPSGVSPCRGVIVERARSRTQPHQTCAAQRFAPGPKRADHRSLFSSAAAIAARPDGGGPSRRPRAIDPAGQIGRALDPTRRAQSLPAVAAGGRGNLRIPAADPPHQAGHRG